MKDKLKAFAFASILLMSVNLHAQQFSLYNTRTLYDAFENPAQKAFKADTSRKFAFNFFVPNFGTSFTAVGDAQLTVKTLLTKQAYTGQGTALGNGNPNYISVNNNTYLMMFRIFRTVNYDQEMGFAWQLRSDTQLKATNETLAIFDDYKLFPANSYSDILNDKGSSQTYHQFGFTYREDYDRRLGLGVKLSYISGIAYNKLEIDNSSLTINREKDSFDLYLKGQFKSNFLYDGVSKKLLYPGFKNPGFSITASTTYKPGNGWYMLGNLKDIGLIKWNKTSYSYAFDQTINKATSSTLEKKIDSTITASVIQKGYVSLLNGKAEVLINKNLGKYQPNFLISKNLFNRGADIGLMNNIAFGIFNANVSAVYNTNNILQLGGMGMIKTPNFEIFAGTDQMFKTYYTTKGIITSNNNLGKGYTGGSFYMGFAIKYGLSMEHPANANVIPGFEKSDDGTERPGFFKRIFSKKAK